MENKEEKLMTKSNSGKREQKEKSSKVECDVNKGESRPTNPETRDF